MKKIRPFLKWAGNKYQCLDAILAALPNAQRLIEPFAGSGAVFVNTDFEKYILAETNHDVVSIFSLVQKEGEAFIDYCAKYFVPENTIAANYYKLREEFNHCKEGRKRAALFLYLNRHGYNGLCRYNASGIYNVPHGYYKKPYFPRAEMLYFHNKSKQTTFLHADFRETFTLAQPGDILYCDPPYVPLSKSADFTTYTKDKFGRTEHIVLAELAKATAKRGIPVIISNHDTEFTRECYREADIISFMVRRFISCMGDNRKPVKELVAVFT